MDRRESPLRVRRATPADRGALLELAAAAFSGLGDYRRILGELLDGAGAVAWIACDEGAPVGMALVAPRAGLGFVAPPLGELAAIAVAAPLRRAGLGGRLLAAAEECARRFGAVEMRLHTAETNHAARRFFAAAGYRPTGAMGVYPNGAGAVEMTHALARSARASEAGQERRASDISR